MATLFTNVFAHFWGHTASMMPQLRENKNSGSQNLENSQIKKKKFSIHDVNQKSLK